MDLKTALHTAARRYCYDRAPGLTPAVQELPDVNGLPEESERTGRADEMWGVREGAMDDILFAIERVVPDAFSNLEELRFVLAMAASSVPEDPDLIRPATRVEADERNLYRKYVTSLTDEALRTVEPLPYRRVLTNTESAELWASLRETWGVPTGSYTFWYPSGSHPDREDVLAFYTYLFEEAIPPQVLRRVLKEHGVQRVLKADAGNASDRYEMDPDFMVLACDWECYWTSADMDWIIYMSHEDAITVGGQWLLDAIQRIWPGWKEGEYAEMHRDWPPQFR